MWAESGKQFWSQVEAEGRVKIVVGVQPQINVSVRRISSYETNMLPIRLRASVLKSCYASYILLEGVLAVISHSSHEWLATPHLYLCIENLADPGLEGKWM